MEKTGNSLIDAHLQGDPTAFDELVRRYGDSLLAYLMRICGNREQAKEIFRETFRSVHEKAHTLRGIQFKSRLYTIATRLAITGLQKSRRMRTVSLNQEFDCDGENCPEPGAVAAAKSPCDTPEEAGRKEQVRRALESLPAGQRVTFVLAYYQGLNYREVAEVMDCSVGTVKTQMYRALRTLAERLPDTSGVAK